MAKGFNFLEELIYYITNYMRLLLKFIIYLVTLSVLMIILYQVPFPFAIIITLLLIIFFSLLFYHTFVKPLNKFLKVFAEITRGEFNQKIKIKAKDEFSILAKAFNQMMLFLKEYKLTLEDRIKELTMLAKISKECAHLEEDKLLPAIVEEVKEIMNVDEVILFLKENDELVIKAQSGIEQEKLKRIKFKVGEGIAGWVAEKGIPCMLNNPSKDERFKILDEQTKIVSLICIPLKIKNSIIGVLSLANYERPFTDDDLHFFNILVSQLSISLYNSQLYKLAITDELTNIYIKRYFNYRLENEVQRAKRYKTPLALIIIDIDHFKSINDKYGHIVGDNILRELAGIITENIRVIDIPARIGGEEFAIILPQTNLLGAEVVAERVRREVERNEFSINGNLLKFTISCGIAELKLEMGSNLLMKVADEALYRAKKEGRNRVSR